MSGLGNIRCPSDEDGSAEGRLVFTAPERNSQKKKATAASHAPDLGI